MTARGLVVADTRGGERALLAIGWAIEAVEIDLVHGRVRMELLSTEGRLVTLDAREGSASITRERVERYVVAVGRRGDRSRAECVRVTFLGRTKLTCGARSALRVLCDYLADNAPVPQIDASAARAAMRLVIGGAEAIVQHATGEEAGR